MKRRIIKSKGVSNIAFIIVVLVLLVGGLSVGMLTKSKSVVQPTPTPEVHSSAVVVIPTTVDKGEAQQQGTFDLITPTPLPTAVPTNTLTPTIVVTVAAGIPTASVPTPTAPSGSSLCSYPSQILNLTNWKETIPLGTNSPIEIFQPELATYMIDPWFKVNASCNAVQFRAHTSSPVTTANSNYPRSELREMTNNGANLASWSSTSGIHTMFIDEAITAVPTGKKHVVAGQIHDSANDIVVIRLEYPKLFIDINGVTGPILDQNYTLGKRFTVKFVVAQGKVDVFYNGSANSTFTLTKNFTNSYFKAGVYTQSNCSKEPQYGATCSDSNYGEVNIYYLWVTHQ